jgi:hypothetical protein
MGKNARVKRARRETRHEEVGKSAAEAMVGLTGGAVRGHEGAGLYRYSLPHVALLILLVFARGIFPIEAEDIFSNIATGEYIWGHKALPTTDPFSFTGPHAWALNRPLACVMMYGVHALGGLSYVQVFCVGLLAIAYTLLYLVWSRRSGDRLTSFLVIALAIMGSCYWFHPRIYVFGYLFFTTTLLLLTSPDIRRAAWVVPIQVLWVNCHPSSIVGVIMTAIWWGTVAFGGVASRRKGSSATLHPASGTLQRREERGVSGAGYASIVLGFTALGSLASSQGLGSVTKLFEELFLAHPSRANIFEWLSPFSPLVSGQHLAWWFFGASVVISMTVCWAMLSRERPAGWGVLLAVTTGFLVMSLGCGRHIPLLYMSASGLLIVTWSRFLAERNGFSTGRSKMAVNLFLCALVLGVITKTALFGYANGDSERKLAFGVDARKFPQKLLLLLKDAKVGGNILVSYDLGSFFIYTMYPQYRVYIDGARLDEVYGEAGYRRYMELGNDAHVLREEFDRYDIRSILVSLPTSESEIVAAYRFLSSSPEWGLAYFDDWHMLYIKRSEAEQRGIPVYRILSPFDSIDQIVNRSPESRVALTGDFEQGEKINPRSLAFLSLKARFERTTGRDQSSTIQRLVVFCSKFDPTSGCRKMAAQHLMGLGAFWESKRVQ